MKKLLALLMSLIFVFSFAACGGKDDGDSDKDDKKEAVADEVENGEESEDEEAEDAGEEDGDEPSTVPADVVSTYSAYEDFHDGVAWVKFNNARNGESWGIIDKKGVMSACFPAAQIRERTAFSNGFAYVKTDAEVKVIDKKGALKASYPISDTVEVIAKADGYAVTRQYNGDFDTSEYIYNICKQDGTSMAKIVLANKVDFYYYGKGIFGYKDGYGNPYNLYFPQAEKWIAIDKYNESSFYFYDDVAVLALTGDYTNDYKGKIITMDTKGTKVETDVPSTFGRFTSWDWKAGPMKNGVSLLMCDNSYFVTFNWADKTFTKGTEESLSKVVYYTAGSNLMFDNGVIAVPMRGSDNSYYVAMYNTKWQQILAPTKVESFQWMSSGRLVADTGSALVIYDAEGNLIKTQSTEGYDNATYYSDSALRVEGQTKPMYLDASGNRLFDDIDISAVL